MIRHARLFLLVSCGLLAAVAASPAAARAGIISDTWMALFGPPGTPYFPGASTSYYGPSYYGSSYYGSSYSVGYAPSYSVGYAPSYYTTGYRSECCRPVRVTYPPSCNPCPTPCNPCPTACDPCPGGNCPTGTAPADNAYNRGPGPRTFKKPDTGAGTGDDPPQPDSKFKSRDDSRKFQATPKGKPDPGDGKKSAAFPTPADENDGSSIGGTGPTARKAFRFPGETDGGKPPGPVIRQDKPVPAKRPIEIKTDRKELPSLALPNFDEKVAWKPVVTRTRLIINARVSPSQLTRTVVDPNEGWTPVRSESRLVRK
jgi:hypothetical protein